MGPTFNLNQSEPEHDAGGMSAFCAPACTGRCAGEGEVVLARNHLARSLPAEDEPGKRQVLPQVLLGAF